MFTVYKEGLIKRLVVGLNLAKALYFLQREHKYVITDFKPQNVLFDTKANIMITDIDSIQLTHQATTYDGGAITPEYAPIETYSSKQFVQSFDSFSFAVILYEIICGIHPYNASFNGQYDGLSTIQDKIKHGLFVYGNVAPKIMAKPHKNYSFLPASIKNLFYKAFVSSQYNTAARPTAEEWGRVLYTELKILDPHLVK
ncbi:MAG: protein kinase [Saprospiraceae bacterium]|nr:protein kinase [Saprospiraceae bacterium]